MVGGVTRAVATVKRAQHVMQGMETVLMDVQLVIKETSVNRVLFIIHIYS